MNFYDILFSKFLNKGGGGDTPSGGYSNPSVTYTVINNSTSTIAMVVPSWSFYDNNGTYEIEKILKEVAPSTTESIEVVALKNYPLVYCVDYNSFYFSMEDPVEQSGDPVLVNIENDDDYGYIITDPTIDASVTITLVDTSWG